MSARIFCAAALQAARERGAQISRQSEDARPANEPGIEINWGGKKYEFASAEEALRAGFHL